MNARDLPEKWEWNAQQEKSMELPDTAVIKVFELCAAELRAALPEQPLANNEDLVSRVAEVIFRTEDKPPGPPEGPLSMYKGPLVKPYYERAREVVKEISTALDAQHDAGRALLRRAETALRIHKGASPIRYGKTANDNLADEIRKHLGDER